MSRSVACVPPTYPLQQTRPSEIQVYYLAFSARKKLHGETCRDNMRLRFLVGHANLLDHIVSQEGKEEPKEEQQTVESEASLQDRILHTTCEDIHDEMTFNTSRAVSAGDDEIEVQFEKGPSSGLPQDECLDQKETGAIVSIKPTIFDVEPKREVLSDEDGEDGELRLRRTPSRCVPPCLSLDTQTKKSDKDLNTSGGIGRVRVEKALEFVTQFIPFFDSQTKKSDENLNNTVEKALEYVTQSVPLLDSETKRSDEDLKSTGRTAPVLLEKALACVAETLPLVSSTGVD